MPSLILQGDTLGKRQKHYNKLVKLMKEAIENTQSLQLEELDFEEDDIENIFKIDIANNCMDVEYILEVLKSEDTLYVSRAIKRCTWLITDRQYADIINPDYLHSQLFPHMTSKAKNKLLLNIRLNLRDESRTEAFYNYCKEKNPDAALKWLPYCSLSLIETEIKEVHSRLISNIPILKQICAKSIKFLEMLCSLEHQDSKYHKKVMLQATMFLINTYCEEYLNIVENAEPFYRPYFGGKSVKRIMDKCPTRIINNFRIYADNMDLSMFARKLKNTENIKMFLLKHVKNEYFEHWFTVDNIKHFVRYMHEEEKVDFIKKVIEKEFDKNTITDNESDIWWPELNTMINKVSLNPDNIYHWYQFAPFEQAFLSLEKQISSDSSSARRNDMLSILIACARGNYKHLHTVLQYYYDNHIEEPFQSKVKFVNDILSQTMVHKYDEETWNILNNIFCSMGVYDELSNDVAYCINAIVAYTILHNKNVPPEIEKKINFTSIMPQITYYSNEDREKIFNYLLNLICTKIQTKKMNTEIEIKDVVSLLEDTLCLLINWEKDLADYPSILKKIKDVVQIKKENNWRVNLSLLFHKKKTWRKLMFVDYIVMSPSEEACINALKYNPDLLKQNKNEVEALCCDDAVSLKKLLNRLRIYWPQTLANEWSNSYMQRLNDTRGYKSLSLGLFTLLPQRCLINILRKYAPTETKSNSSDDLNMSRLRNNFAKIMYVARPPLPLDVVLLYAEGDCLQHVHPAMSALLYNMSSINFCKCIVKFLNKPLSLQKLALRLAFVKLNYVELKKIVPEFWRCTSDPAIRKLIFKSTIDLLCKETDHSLTDELWELHSILTDDLSLNENEDIFEILIRVDKVPIIIRDKYSMKSYNCLKSLSTKANCETVTRRIMKFISDEQFVANVLLESLEAKFTTGLYEYEKIMSSYLLSADNEATQTRRLDKIVGPLLKHILTVCIDVEEEHKRVYYIRKNIINLLKQLCHDFPKYVFQKDMVYPTKMFRDIQNILQINITAEDCYVVLRYWELAACFVKTLEPYQDLVSTIRCRSTFRDDYDVYYTYYFPDKTWNEVYIKATPDFAEACLQYLKKDIEKYGSTMWRFFATSLQKMFKYFELDEVVLIETLKWMLVSEKTFIEAYLLVINALPKFGNSQIHKLINLHPSVEVKLHYYDRFQNGYEDY